MLFNSLEFLLFLPLTVVGFWALPPRARLPLLLTASLVFYASFGVGNLVHLGLVAAIALAAGRYLLNPEAPRRHAVFWSGVAAILALLALLKYYDPLAADIPGLPQLGLSAPAGFSFYAFTAIALLADRYRIPDRSAASTGEDLLFLAWFPKILAGPIERIAPFAGEIGKRKAPNPAVLAVGAQLILWGLVKKVVVADNLAPFVDRVYAIPDYAVPLELIIATYFFAFQIYCDFSGYTDIARGASLLFGIKLVENFRRSYFAQSIGEFWSRRWHISLSEWFRDFVYYPFCGEYPTALRMYLGAMLVFVASGIWHAGLGYGIGWGFVAWGVLNGLYLWGERGLNPYRRQLRKRPRGSRWEPVYGLIAGLLVFHLILVSWVFFRAGTIGESATILSRVWTALPEIPNLISRYPFTAEHGFLAVLILALLAIEAVLEREGLRQRLARSPRAARWAIWYALIFALILLGRWQSEAFVYMQF